MNRAVMYRQLFVFATATFFATGLHAADTPDPLAPVQRVMAITVSNWAEGNNDFKDIFGDDTLKANFSNAFVSFYQAKSKAANEAEGERLVDWDPVTGGQDGCPITDVSYKNEGQKDGHTVVTVSFHAFQCFEDSPEAKETQSTEFDLVQDGDAYKIDDIKTGGTDSLRAALSENQPD